MSMQDPSAGVPSQLLNHVHLRSAYQYPYTPQPLPFDHVLDLLLKAPQIMRDVPVAWTYIQPPSDGTLILVWRPPNGRPLATDGIMWAGAESTFKHDLVDYTIESAVYTAGFVYNQDQTTTRRRTRYKLIATTNNTPFDPNLELLHWTPSAPENRMPTQRATLQPYQQQQLRERRFLEMQGPLPRKEFLLNDRNSWPTINLPANPTPQNPYQNPIQNRGALPAFNRTPSATRPLTGAMPGMPPSMRKPSQPGGMLSTPFSNLAEDILESERNTEFGDMLDFLSPREISVARYKQHHEWMEEIVAGPWAMKDILPVDLGLRLAGSLKGLTDDLWADAAMLEVEGAARKTDPARLQAFNERMAKHLSDGEQELAEMRRAHAAQMEEITQQKLFVNLERKLAETSRDGVQVGLDDITREAEEAFGGKLRGRADIVAVSKGGLLGKGEENAATHQQPDEFHAGFGNLDTAGEALNFFSEDVGYPAEEPGYPT